MLMQHLLPLQQQGERAAPAPACTPAARPSSMMAFADAPVSDSAGSEAATWCPYCFSIHLRQTSAQLDYPSLSPRHQ